MSAIVMEQAEKTFDPGKAGELTALANMSIEILAGKAVIVAGPSGSGKTTFLSLAGLLSRPTAGRVAILGKETTLLSESLRTELRRRHIGFTFQHFNLFGDMTVRENLDLVLYPDGVPFKKIVSARQSLLERFGLLRKADCRASVLSGGEKQRLAIARSLMNDPEIVLVDEPTAHLDTALSLEVIEMFRQLNREGKTLVISSHDPLVLDSGLADSILHLRDGRVVAES
jgi:putative ABC transport system ATP-binding protein